MHKLNSYAAAPLRFAFVTSREQKQKKKQNKTKEANKKKEREIPKKTQRNKETKKNKYIFTLVKRSIFILNTSLEQ